MTKIIFLDVDGTIVNYENQLPQSAVTAIKKAQANGHKVYTVTGRSKAEMYQNILDIGFDGYIGGNGSYIESGDEIIKEQTLTAADTRQIVDWLHEQGLEYYLESNNGLFASQHFAQRGQSTIREYSARKGLGDTSMSQAFPDMIYGADPYRDDINKISFILDSYQDYLEAVKKFPGFKVGTWGGVGEKALFGDIALGAIDKAVAIDELLNHLHVDVVDTFAFGDAKVDIPMLEHCEIGVAMGNGGPEIKAMADHITDDVDADGLYKAFQHFGLI